jgi:hypothetical protein
MNVEVVVVVAVSMRHPPAEVSTRAFSGAKTYRLSSWMYATTPAPSYNDNTRRYTRDPTEEYEYRDRIKLT